MTDRLIGAGRLPRALVEDYAAVGPLARGSGSPSTPVTSAPTATTGGSGCGS